MLVCSWRLRPMVQAITCKLPAIFSVYGTYSPGANIVSYVYGGRGESRQVFDDIFVLSLPSFTWTKIYQGNSPRHSHSCHRLGSRLMVSVGGMMSFNTTAAPCDWLRKGVAILDMSNVTWSSVYNQSAPSYTVPAAVVAKIGGT